MIIAWAHNRFVSGDGTVPVICHATQKQMDALEDSADWHQASEDEYERYESYWGKEFPHQEQYVIEETPA